MRPLIFSTTFVIVTAGVALAACTDKSHERHQSVESLTYRTTANLVQVHGGQFKMGDFGQLIPETEALYFSADSDNKPVHTVELSPFSIQKYRVTHQEYDHYLAVTGKPDKSYHRDPHSLPDNSNHIDPNTRWPDEAVSVDWYEANDYCSWLGHQIGLQGNLPTEAQWEYAARSKGQLILFATDNGKAEEGRNIPTLDEIRDMHPEDSYNQTIRVGRFPPNSLGLYDMGYGGLEWVQDWYAPDYYQHSPLKDPQGPTTGAEKVQRGKRNNEDGYAMKNDQLTFVRYHSALDLYDPIDQKKALTPGNGMRCVFVAKP